MQMRPKVELTPEEWLGGSAKQVRQFTQEQTLQVAQDLVTANPANTAMHSTLRDESNQSQLPKVIFNSSLY
jgi:hypothetical protein